MLTPPRPIYLDHHATTPVDPRVVTVIARTLTETYGNPNSTDHAFGDAAQLLVDLAAEHVAQLVGASSSLQVHFTSGSSESLALALQHAEATSASPLQVAANPLEHRALLDLLNSGQHQGTIAIRWLAVDHLGRLDLTDLEETLRKGIDLVCLMSANNEIGNLYPVSDVARLCQNYGSRLLVDATQSVGREPLSLDDWGIDYLTLSAHKMYGPKGVGALVVSTNMQQQSPATLSHHGTPNVPGIAGLGEAARLRQIEMQQDEPRIRALRDDLQRRLIELIPGLVINGDMENRLSHNLHISIPNVPNSAVTSRLRETVAISTGSACTSGAQEASHVLRALRLPEEHQEGALRLSPGKFTTPEEIKQAAELIAKAVQEIRMLFGFPA